MNWSNKLKERWKLKRTSDVFRVLLVFAMTGTTVVLIKKPLLASLSFDVEDNIWFSVIYYILILPVYNLILLIYGFLLGRFRFFWEFEKRFFNRLFRRKKEKTA